jgi:transposase
MHQLDLTRLRCRRLEEQLKTTGDARVYQRTLAILEIARGRPVAEIAQMLRVTRQIVYRWIALYVESHDPDALVDRKRLGRPPIWSDDADGILRSALAHSPTQFGFRAVSWTVPLLCEYIGSLCGQKPSDRQVTRKLRELNYVWKRPRHALPETKSPRVRRRLWLIRKKVRNLPAGCAKLFADETDVLLFPPLRAGWFQRGRPAEVPISGENAKRTIFGTIDVETGRRILTAREGACGADFRAILRQIRLQYGGQKVALLLDGASRHRAYESTDLAAELAIELMWLPARCTNINPMDRLWRWGKEKICANKQYLSIDYQVERFIEYLLGLSPQEALRKAGILSGNFWLFR